ncbi:MAG: DHH family phosphoesterase [Haloferacaceae archaeon]
MSPTDFVHRDVLPAAVSESPELLVLAVLAVLGLLAFSALVYRWVFATPGKRFARTVGSLDAAAILMHPNPDPDAMSCALAAQTIAEGVDTETTLYHPGQIRHHENRAFETVLDVDFERIGSVGEIDEEEVVLVDHNEPRGFEGARKLDPVAVVDHHPGDGTGSSFTDVRPDYGACATVFTEYFRQLGHRPVGPDGEDDDDGRTIPPRVATGLLYGIQSDTKHLTSGCSAAEFDAAAYLYPGIDGDKLNRIANPDMDMETIEVKAQAIRSRDVRGVFAISDVGEVSNVDAIPQAADELRRLEGINAVVVLGHHDGTIQLSGRSTDDRVHMGKVIETAVEVVPMANGGGHARMGGGQVPVDHMEGLGPSEGLTREELKDRLFDAMNGEL